VEKDLKPFRERLQPAGVTVAGTESLLEMVMARAKVEQQQPATGMTLIVWSTAIAFLLFMAF